MEYAEEYCNNFSYHNAAPNRKKHVPYVFKALSMNGIAKIVKEILIIQN